MEFLAGAVVYVTWSIALYGLMVTEVGSSAATTNKSLRNELELLQKTVDALRETHDTEWYKRLFEAAEAATQMEPIAKGRIERY